MKRTDIGLLAIAFFVGAGAALNAQTAPVPPAEPHWWEIATGVLAVPAAIIGLAYSYVLVGKTRLESRKTELEIREKETQLRLLPDAERDAAAKMIAPLMQGQIWQYLFLRFILLYIVLGLWGVVEDLFDVLFTGAMATAQSVFQVDLNRPWILLPVVLAQQLPKIGRWALFLALALPLFRDVNAVVGLRLKDVFSIRHRSDAVER